MRSQQKLLARYLENIQPGRLEWIGLRPARREAMQTVNSVQAIAEYGLEGDRRCEATPGSGRQVTFISQEHIDVIASLLGRKSLQPALLRRNLVISGINLNILRHQHFQIGNAIFLGTAPCHPCSRMNEVLGPQGAAMMYGHGGLCAKIIQSGDINIGDSLVPIQR
ncbi:MOSC domain-containing protein [Maricurvus nonylphenolicus]|uniref:MOSC domain-containing protein n=1 Tax=Maricurvus nonylphenolicus TaxID=1008307 RepID=UPI0036F34157